jgi:predicted anti-sigma-YlaC factor YlaD
MNCETFRDRLFDYLAGTPVERAAFDAHRAGCAACAALLSGVSENETLLRGARVPTAPADLWPRIAQAIARPVPRRRWLPWSAAAAALLAVGALFFTSSGPRATLDVAIVDASPESGRAFTALVPRYEDVDPGLALADTMFRFED